MCVIMTFHICDFAMSSGNVDFFHGLVSDVDREFWVGVQNDQDGLGFLEVRYHRVRLNQVDAEAWDNMQVMCPYLNLKVVQNMSESTRLNQRMICGTQSGY